MRIRRTLFERVLHIAERDHLSAADIAHMCGTSRPRAHTLLTRRIERFNSETLIDILFRLGVELAVEVRATRAYRKMEFPNPAVERRFIEPWRT
jgi:predicted XRE-type DNA-binding protein